MEIQKQLLPALTQFDRSDESSLLGTLQVASRLVKPKTILRYTSRNLLNYTRVGNRLPFRAVAVGLFPMQRERAGVCP